MPNISQLPFLIKLVDDPSPTVWAKVARELRAFGPALWQEIGRQQIELTPQQRSFMEDMLQEVDLDNFRETWLDWLHLENEDQKLETALSRLAVWQMGHQQPVRAAMLTELLDDLSAQFRAGSYFSDAASLSRFLFSEKAFSGVEAEHYYDPLNSNLIHVIQSGHGIPISLTVIFILVGARVGIEIYGCNFPGHFLARAHGAGHDLFFDCFSEGRLLTDEETQALRKAAPEAVSSPASAVMIVARVLSNLANAYYQAGDAEHTQYVLGLLQDLESSSSA